MDIKPQKNYPFTFIQADAMTFPLEGFDVIHASPPCQAYSNASKLNPGKEYPRLVGQLRTVLLDSGIPYVIENVPGAPLAFPIVLCGSMFGLRLKRHRLFESSIGMLARPCGVHGDYISIFGHEVRMREPGRGKNRPRSRLPTEIGRQAMGIGWMNREELSQAIPPAYTHWIGKQLIKALGGEWKGERDDAIADGVWVGPEKGSE